MTAGKARPVPVPVEVPFAGGPALSKAKTLRTRGTPRAANQATRPIIEFRTSARTGILLKKSFH